MLYILEGPDCSGKSTCFAGIQSQHPDALYIKESHTPIVEERVQRLERLLRLVAQCERTVVLDRATIVDDFVYGFLNDTGETVLNDYIDEVQSVLDNATIIYFDAPTEVLAERLAKRKDAYIDSDETFGKIKDGYQKFFERFRPTVIDIDTSKMPVDKMIDVVSKIIFPKQFKFAHIVPLENLSSISQNGYLMCLAHLVPKNQAYGLFYRLASERNGQYVLMDNGAAEGEQMSNDRLLDVYDFIKPDEIVLPDTLLDGEETVRKAKEAIPMFKRHEGFDAKMMAVPQGKTIEEWTKCARELIQLPEVDSIGVSKFLQMEVGDEYTRLEAAIILNALFHEYNRRDIEVHLLGLSEAPGIVNIIQREFPFVRGCDSAYGYLAHKAGSVLSATMERPEGDIDFLNGDKASNLQETLQKLNITTGAFDNGIDLNWKPSKQTLEDN